MLTLPTSSTKFLNLQGVFLTGPPLQTGPPKKCFDWPPPKLSKCWNHIHFARHLGVFRSEGGPVWDSNVFLKSVTYRPTLSKFRGGPVKKNTLYDLVNPVFHKFEYTHARIVIGEYALLSDYYYASLKQSSQSLTADCSFLSLNPPTLSNMS